MPCAAGWRHTARVGSAEPQSGSQTARQVPISRHWPGPSWREWKKGKVFCQRPTHEKRKNHFNCKHHSKTKVMEMVSFPCNHFYVECVFAKVSAEELRRNPALDVVKKHQTGEWDNCALKKNPSKHGTPISWLFMKWFSVTLEKQTDCGFWRVSIRSWNLQRHESLPPPSLLLLLFVANQNNMSDVSPVTRWE